MIEPFHSRFGEAEPLNLFGVQIRILMPAAALDGGLSIFEDRNEPGAGPPLHVHHDAEEVFHILDGDYRFQCGAAVIEAGRGDIVVVPRGMPHTYLNIGAGTGRLLATMRPGGFEGFFREVAAGNLQTPDDMPAIIEIAARYQIEFLGPNPLAG
jgi:mannose-6-phosphate isomerase-like protein (cupin superfamily)